MQISLPIPPGLSILKTQTNPPLAHQSLTFNPDCTLKLLLLLPLHHPEPPLTKICTNLSRVGLVLFCICNPDGSCRHRTPPIQPHSHSTPKPKRNSFLISTNSRLHFFTTTDHYSRYILCHSYSKLLDSLPLSNITPTAFVHRHRFPLYPYVNIRLN